MESAAFAERNVMESLPDLRPRLHPCGLMLAAGSPWPISRFPRRQLAELDRRSRQRRAAEVSETGLHLGVVESCVDLLVELVDDLGQRGLRCAEAVPNTPPS